MTQLVKDGVRFKSNPPPQTILVGALTGILAGQVATWQLNTLQPFISDCRTRGYRVRFHSFTVAVRQTRTVAVDVAGPLYDGQVSVRALDRVWINNAVSGTDYMFADSDDTNGPGCANFASACFVNPLEYQRAIQDIAELTGPFPQYSRDDITLNPMALRGTDGQAIDARQSWWEVDSKTRLVAAVGAPVVDAGGLSPLEFCVLPTTLAASSQSDSCVPSEVFVTPTQFATVNYVPNNNTTLFAPGTVFGNFDLALYVRVSFQRIEEPPVCGDVYYVDRWQSSSPINPPTTDNAILLAIAPEFRSTSVNGGIAYNPRVAFEIPNLATFFGATASLRWYEPNANGALEQTYPLSDNYLNCFNLLDWYSIATAPAFGISRNEYGFKPVRFAIASTSTLFSDTWPGAIGFTANGVTSASLTNRVSPLSSLPMFPVLFVYTGMPGFPGGPYSGGDNTCPSQVQLNNITLAAPWLQGGNYRFLRVRLRPELKAKFLAQTECGNGCGAKPPTVPIVDNPNSPKAKVVEELVPVTVPQGLVNQVAAK